MLRTSSHNSLACLSSFPKSKIKKHVPITFSRLALKRDESG